MPDRNNESILILAPVGRDAELAAAALKDVGISSKICRDLRDLVNNLQSPCGAALIAEESLHGSDFAALTDQMLAQPAWSDLPIIVLTSGRIATNMSRNLLDLFAPQGNITLLERPIRVITLCSMLEVALRARRRQYEVRDLLEEREAVLASERAARSEAERAGRMKDEFLATLSHELRTPLNAILGWSSILREEPGDQEELAQGLETIERNARAQSKIINDLLDMSRIASGKISLEYSHFDLVALLEESIKTVLPAASGRRIRLELIAETCHLSGDPNRLQQIFFNLLNNAIKFTQAEGVVKIIVKNQADTVEVRISDTGMGIAPEFLDIVFDRFRQADASSTRQHGGLGLGLAIVKQLVELHGGTVSVKSPGIGLGSTFSVTLPIRNAVSSHAAASHLSVAPPLETAQPLSHVSERLEGIRILVVDDEPDARSMMKRLLQDSHAIVDTAGSASEAFALFQTEPPDVLVSDIGMPGENGYQLIRRIRALPENAGGKVPAVALTAYARAEDRAQAINAGFHRHAIKPVEAFELIHLLTTLLEEK